MTGNHLDSTTEEVDTATGDNSPFATNSLSDISGNEGAEESTSRKDRDDQGVVGAGEALGALAGDHVDEDPGAGDTIDITGIITKEDTSKGSKGADEICLPCHGSLDGIDIVSGLEAGNEIGVLCGGHGNGGMLGRGAIGGEVVLFVHCRGGIYKKCRGLQGARVESWVRDQQRGSWEFI